MSEVKRYTKKRTRAQIELAKPGTEFVLVSDYDALAAECERLREERDSYQRIGIRNMQACDAALAELAALKGGQEAVAWQVGHPQVAGGWKCYERYPDWADGHPALTIRPLYPAPPAQASAWVPVSESLPADRRDVMLYCADTKEHFVGFSKGGGLFQFAQDGNGLSIVCRPSHWRYIEDSDAPTPGASDGKGGE